MPKPNIVLVCSDQHSSRYTGYAGHPLVKTPNLDRLAAQGTAFSNTYCGSPVCVPGRACMMTGMYPSDEGSYCNSTVYDGSHPTWAQRLSDDGYECWATGKFDLNSDFPTGFREVETRNGGEFPAHFLFRGIASELGNILNTRHVIFSKATWGNPSTLSL